jgi:hypothetical protein
MAVIVVLGGYIAYQRLQPLLSGSGCTAASGGKDIPLGTGQAGI